MHSDGKLTVVVLRILFEDSSTFVKSRVIYSLPSTKKDAVSVFKEMEFCKYCIVFLKTEYIEDCKCIIRVAVVEEEEKAGLNG